MNLRTQSTVVLAVLIAICLPPYARADDTPPPALAVLKGTDMKGGAAELFGSTFGGMAGVNYVYAMPTGARSAMEGSFTLSKLPDEPVFLHLKARDDDGAGKCSIAILVNGRSIFEGHDEFSETEWLTRMLPIPADALKVGRNSLRVECREAQGVVGMPPWFQVARAVVAGERYRIVRDVTKDFYVILPKTLREFPEPLPAGRKPGFAYRGIKGWMWTPEQYLSEIPVMARYKMNFLMSCYTSLCDIEHYTWGDPQVNRWWEDLPSAKKTAYEEIVRRCRKHGIEFCFSMNPNLCSKRPLNYASDGDIDLLWKHYRWMQGLGVRWFNISLDDISQGIDPAGQARVVNEILRRLRKADPRAWMIFCPTIYWGDGTLPSDRSYLETLARDLDPDVFVFWTGNAVVGEITRAAAESYRAVVKHHLFLWDNYPVNDGNPTMHLGPVVDRDADLCEVVDGYMSNSMCRQSESNRIPMLTCADYAYNPSAYDPARSIGQAIIHLEREPSQRELIRELVEWYPGFVIYGMGGTGLNPARDRFTRLCDTPHSRGLAEAMAKSIESLSRRMDRAFPSRYSAERRVLRDDAAYLRSLLTGRYSGAD